VVDLLTESGYGGDDIISASYNKSSLGTIVYTIDYENLDGEIETANIYISIENGKLVAEF
jgi:hypothetical protein